MSILAASLALGLVLSVLALGVFISFRVLNFPDITVDGSFALGGATAAAWIAAGGDPWIGTLLGTLASAVAGACTGAIHVLVGVNGLLAGILVMTGLYSVNLRVMGRSNVPLLDLPTVLRGPESWLHARFGEAGIPVAGQSVAQPDAAALLAGALAAISVMAALRWFLATNLGGAMRATGDNPRMIRALGVPTGAMIVFGLALSNALSGLSGALFAQVLGFADAQMGIGIVVTGLASVIIGQSLVGTAGTGTTLVAVVMGSVIFRLLVAIALRVGLDPNDLKLITAVFVLAALALPKVLARRRVRHA
jgi:putative ABC transport system permease protein